MVLLVVPLVDGQGTNPLFQFFGEGNAGPAQFFSQFPSLPGGSNPFQSLMQQQQQSSPSGSQQQTQSGDSSEQPPASSSSQGLPLFKFPPNGQSLIPTSPDQWMKQLNLPDSFGSFPQQFDDIRAQLDKSPFSSVFKQQSFNGFDASSLPICSEGAALDFLNQFPGAQKSDGNALMQTVKQLVNGPRELLLALQICKK